MDITCRRLIVGRCRNAGLDLTACPFPTGDSHSPYRIAGADHHSNAYRWMCADRFCAVVAREVLIP